MGLETRKGKGFCGEYKINNNTKCQHYIISSIFYKLLTKSMDEILLP